MSHESTNHDEASNLPWRLRCISCERAYGGLEVRYRCDCGDLLAVEHLFVHERIAGAMRRAREQTGLPVRTPNELFDARRLLKSNIDRSGVWRFRELIVPLDDEFIVTKPEGNTNLYVSRSISDWTGVGCLTIKHEGENPTGSFKDRGMTAGISVARALGMRAVACASTGNTSAAMASYASQAGMRGFVFIPSGKIAYGKLAQSLAYGATTIQIDGDFDDAMRLVQQVCDTRGIYLLNSANPFRIEGQKAIGFELLQDLDWHVPDWVILPGGNLGNSSALHKGLVELRALGLIDKLPRIAVIQAQGANPLARWFSHRGAFEPLVGAETLATAIRIGSPVSFKKCIAGIEETHGFVTDVTDAEILEAKAVVDASGIGAEPASCASIAGLRKLVESGIIDPNASVAAILTGHVLKDPDTVVHYHRDSNLDEAPRANRPRKAPATLDGVLEAMGI